MVQYVTSVPQVIMAIIATLLHVLCKMKKKSNNICIIKHCIKENQKYLCYYISCLNTSSRRPRAGSRANFVTILCMLVLYMCYILCFVSTVFAFWSQCNSSHNWKLIVFFILKKLRYICVMGYKEKKKR